MGGGEHLPIVLTEVGGRQDDKDQETFNVLVTGFGNWPEGGIPVNAANAVAGLLPNLLPANSELNCSSHTINILTPTAANNTTAIKVEYGYIRNYIKALHDKHSPAPSKADTTPTRPKVHLFIHLGHWAESNRVRVERAAYKQSMTTNWWTPQDDTRGYYVRHDAVGQNIHDLGPCPWDDSIPIGLSSSMDVDAVASNAQAVLSRCTRPAMPVRLHHEAGYHCCGFIYYESLAQRYARGLPGCVLFCHVPGLTDRESLVRSASSVCAIIGAAVKEVAEGRSDGREW